MKLRWSSEALHSLEEIETFIAGDNDESASKFIGTLMHKAESLLENPQRGRIVPEINQQDVHEIIFKNYRIVYRIGHTQIIILTIFEAHRLLPRSAL